MLCCTVFYFVLGNWGRCSRLSSNRELERGRAAASADATPLLGRNMEARGALM
jgi:hypothetical protein